MAFQRPSLTDIIGRILADIATRMLGGQDSVLRRSVLGIIGRALAGASHELHGHLDYIGRQVIVDTADQEYLERWANIWQITRKAAAYATGNVTLSGVNGAILPSGAILQRQDGALFVTQADATIAFGTATVAVKAQAAGAAGNTDAATKLTLQQPASGVQSAVTVAAGGLTSGADQESDDSLRARLLTRIQQPPQGGDAADYEAWALQIAGVTRAWVAPQEMGAGTVTVRFTRDNDASIIPDAAEVTAVQNHIDGLRPVTAQVFVAAPVAAPINFSISIKPNTAAVQQAITDELDDLLRREAVPGGKILISHIREAVSIAAGETDNAVTSPVADVTNATGNIATLGTITFATLP